MTTDSNAPAMDGRQGEGETNGRAAQGHDSNSSIPPRQNWPANTGDMDAMPVALREIAEFPQWVGFRLEYNGKTYPDGRPKADKVPYNPHAREWKSDPDPKKARGRASSTNPKTWGTYAQAVAALHRHGAAGVGFVFHPETSPVLGVDLDGCMVDGKPTPVAQKVIDLCDTYGERSPSGDGIHLLMKGRLPPGRRRKGPFEVYSEGRFFTVTGCHLEGTPDSIEERTAALADLHADVFGTDNADGRTPPKRSFSPGGAGALTDAEVLELAFKANNGAKVQSLYGGDTTGYPSASEADAALAAALVFYTDDAAQTVRLMQGSRLYREGKWDRPDYLKTTVDNAMGFVTERYRPAGVPKNLNGNGKKPAAGVDTETGEILDAEPSAGMSPDEMLTDLGNALQFIRRHGENLRWVPQWGAWAVYDGRRWQKDERLEAERLAKATVMAMLEEVVHNEGLGTKARARLAKHALQSQAAKRLRDMVHVARMEAVASVQSFDADPWLLNCRNGTVDLRTGELRPHRREDLLSKITRTDYDPTATCPTWLKCLETWLPDPNVRDYFQEAVGYALTGSVQEECFFFLHGTGRNGKGTSMNTLHRILGDYAQAARPEILLAKKGDGGIGNEVAELKGARMVLTKEVDRGRPFSEAQLKNLTGKDKRRGRFLFQNSFEYWPTDKIFLEANHRPIVRDLTFAFWRRVKLIPFTVTIPESDVIPDLTERLQAEWPGILAWAVAGCRRWYDRGRLEDPPAVSAAVAAYREESNVLGDFLSERCALGPHLRATLAEVYTDYQAWCDGNREKATGKGDFRSRLLEQERLDVRKATGNKTYVFGLALKGTAVTDTLDGMDAPAEEVF